MQTAPRSGMINSASYQIVAGMVHLDIADHRKVDAASDKLGAPDHLGLDP